MDFLRKEVEQEERISIAMKGFDISSSDCKLKMVGGPAAMEASSATAAGLVNTKGKISDDACIFCQGAHFSADCLKSCRMTVVEKCQFIDSNKCCFVCLKSGHILRRCEITCMACGAKHITLMFRKLEEDTAKHPGKIFVDNVEKTLANHSYLILCCKSLSILTEVGSQLSYITKELAAEMGYQSNGEEQLRHGPFGDHKSSEVHRTRFLVTIRNICSNYISNFYCLHQDIIFCSIPTADGKECQKILKEIGIEIKR
ncbi:hypothetical protein PR048_011854 [Dryococelus australis]|uniref:Uncharacterized protein n=1 Tax=Dryococelus australis TaxID=614101 RepID=A0ABQ9HMU2_9NEOP|nr:hypothetical protein PR048_011854 [Dryococelus australis]